MILPRSARAFSRAATDLLATLLSNSFRCPFREGERPIIIGTSGADVAHQRPNCSGAGRQLVRVQLTSSIVAVCRVSLTRLGARLPLGLPRLRTRTSVSSTSLSLSPASSAPLANRYQDKVISAASLFAHLFVAGRKGCVGLTCVGPVLYEEVMRCRYNM